jgi:diguanylate cyclase (GGDEF)-like protein
MSRRAWAYIIGTIVLGGAMSALTLLAPFPTQSDWTTLVALALFAAISQLYKSLFSTKSAGDQGSTSYSPAYIFFSAGILLLPPALFVLLVLVPHLLEWLKERYGKSNNLLAWYIQPFNIATHIVCGLIAQRAFLALVPVTLFTQVPSHLIAALVMALLYVGLNHAMVGLAMFLARGITWQESGVMEFKNLTPDFIMLSLGYAVAVLWAINPWLILPALSPLVLIQRALRVPQLEQEARVDGKTGLWNARYFAEALKAEFKRAKRFERPFAIIMSDLDLLRNINNTYGHLAGDAVLEQIGQIIRKTVREYDIAARFGGEELVIAMPETDSAQAVALAERIRQAVESTEFRAKTTPTSIRATISLGTAYFPMDATTTNELIHAADVAVYQAKLNGRNRVVSFSDVPRSVSLETLVTQDRLAAPSMPHPMPRPLPEAEPIQGKEQDSPHQNHATGDTLSEAESAMPTAEGPAERPVRGNERSEQRQAGAASSKSEHPKVQPPRGAHWQVLLYAFLSLIIGLGALVSISAFALGGTRDLTVIGLLTALAVISELLQVEAADENTLSVSVAINFAAALIAGLVGLVFTSGAIALTHRLRQPSSGGSALYKTAFNWSVHLIAGLVPLSIIGLLNLPFEASNLPLLLLATAFATMLYFSLETGLITLAIALSSRASAVTVWKNNFSWLTGHYAALCLMGLIIAIAYHALGVLGMIAFALPALTMRYAQAQYVERTRGSVQELKRVNQQLARANDEIVRASHSIRRLNDELFLTLAKIIDTRDPYVSGHALKVSEYATAIATELSLPPDRVEQVRQAAFLHDIGKLGIPESILHKPDRLTPEEYELVKTHVTLGGDLIETSEGLRHLATFVRHHHEWWNGRGYPDHWHGEQIPLEARILSVCDAVEAMASDRPYHRAMLLDEIIAEIRRYAGTQFDSVVVETFARVAEREGTRLVTNSAREVQHRNGTNGDPTRVERRSPQDLEFIVLPESRQS